MINLQEILRGTVVDWLTVAEKDKKTERGFWKTLYWKNAD
jgi:hypothetical protein